MSSRDVRGQCNGADRVEDQEEVGLEDHRETSCDETTDREGDETVREHLGGL